MIRLRLRLPFRSEWTEIFLDGEEEDGFTNILAAGVLAQDGEAERFDANEEEWVPIEEFFDAED